MEHWICAGFYVLAYALFIITMIVLSKINRLKYKLRNCEEAIRELRSDYYKILYK